MSKPQKRLSNRALAAVLAFGVAAAIVAIAVIVSTAPAVFGTVGSDGGDSSTSPPPSIHRYGPPLPAVIDGPPPCFIDPGQPVCIVYAPEFARLEASGWRAGSLQAMYGGGR